MTTDTGSERTGPILHNSGVGPSVRPSPAVLKARRERLLAAIAIDGIDVAIVAPGADLRYLLGDSFPSFERLTALVLGRSVCLLVVPEMELSAWSTVVAQSSLEVFAWADWQDPYAVIVDLVGTNSVVAVSHELPARHLVTLQEAVGQAAEWRLNSAVTSLRGVKDDWEINQIEGAASAIDDVHAAVPGLLRPGRTEAAVAADIQHVMRENGFTDSEFIAVASGPNAANPHHSANARTIERGDLVLVDLSGRWHGGYFADSTRTYAVSTPLPETARAYAALLRSFECAVSAVKPGVTAQQVDLAARNELSEHGLAELFIHRTGHGIGLDVHEDPSLVRGNEELLRDGMAFTIEPGIYLPGRFGARIEDVVVMTNGVARQLNARPHELLVV